MARTKQTARQSTGGMAPRKQLANSHCRWPVCYELGYGVRHILKSRKGRHSQRPKSHSQDTDSSQILANFKRPMTFPHFTKLPIEIQHSVWEMSAEEPRVVAVHTKTNSGLRSSVPPILHVCSESRAVGLKHYTLAFASRQFSQPPNVYFNFERDTLYLREDWNSNVTGGWCCLSRFDALVNEEDLKRVKTLGMDVNARVCSLKTSGKSCHLPNFAHWDGLQILYLGYEDARLGSDCLIKFKELESKDYEGFMKRYKLNPCWGNATRLPQEDEAAVEYLRKEVPIMYHGFWDKPDCFLSKLELVSVGHL